MQDKTDSASVASTSTFSSRVSLLKDKLRSSSSSKKESDNEAREKKMKEDALKSQIRMGI
jgi:hypothetical protein